MEVPHRVVPGRNDRFECYMCHKGGLGGGGDFLEGEVNKGRRMEGHGSVRVLGESDTFRDTRNDFGAIRGRSSHGRDYPVRGGHVVREGGLEKGCARRVYEEIGREREMELAREGKMVSSAFLVWRVEGK